MHLQGVLCRVWTRDKKIHRRIKRVPRIKSQHYMLDIVQTHCSVLSWRRSPWPKDPEFFASFVSAWQHDTIPCASSFTRVWPDGKHVSCTVRFAFTHAANFVFRNAYLFNSSKHNFQLYTPANHGTYGIRVQDGRLIFEVSQLRHDMSVPSHIHVCIHTYSMNVHPAHFKQSMSIDWVV